MTEFHGHVTAVAQEVLGDETTTAYLAGQTVIGVADTVDFYEEGGSVLIAGEVYTYSEMDDGDDSNTPSITLTSGLLADLPAESRVDVWNPNAGAVVTEWSATVTDDNDGSAMTAPLTHTLVALLAEGVGGLVGESVVCRTDEAGEWWVVEVIGARPRIQPGFFVSGGIGTDTVVWAGTENGRRAQLDGIDGALECFNSSNVQTVNLDGDVNYIEGSLATAASGARVEIGAGDNLGDPVDEIRLFSGEGHETASAYVRVMVDEPEPILLPGVDEALLELRPPAWSGAPAVRPVLYLATGLSNGGASSASLLADSVTVGGSGGVTIGGNLNATMGAGSIGTGTVRDSVDARVPVVLAAMGHIERSETAQSIASGGAPTVVTWATSTVAGRGGVSYSAGVFTLAQAGTYLTKVYTSFPAGVGARRQCQIRKNGTVGAQTNQTPPTTGVWSAVTTELLDYAAGDTIDVRVFQDSGGALVITGAITIHRVA